MSNIRSLKSWVGRSSSLFYKEVTSAMLESFGQAVCAEDHRLTPPTFLTLFRQGEFELLKDMGIDLSRILHAEQEYEYNDPIQAGDQIAYQAVLSQVLEKQGSTAFMQFLTFESTMTVEKSIHSQRKPALSLESKSEVGRAKSTIVIRHLLQAEKV